MYINAFWLHLNMNLQNFAQKLTYTKTIFFRLSTALIRPDYVTDDKRSLSTCLNILIAAFWTILLGPLSFLGIHQRDQDPLYH